MHLRCLPRIFNHSACNNYAVTEWVITLFRDLVFSQLTITCSKLTIEKLEQGVKYAQS